MPLLGRNGAILLGKQTALGTKQSTLIQKVFQTSGGGLGPVAEFGRPELNDGSLAPGRPVIGQAGSEGSIRILQDATGLGVLLEALMLADATTAAYHAALWDIHAAAAYTSGTAITTFIAGSQPKANLQDATFVTAGTITGVNAARLKFTFAGSPSTRHESENRHPGLRSSGKRCGRQPAQTRHRDKTSSHWRSNHAFFQ